MTPEEIAAKLTVSLPIQCVNAKMVRHGEGFKTSPAPNRNGSRKDHVMAAKALPSSEVLRQLLRYEPETGKLFWLPRGVASFDFSHDAVRLAAAWNGRNAGNEAFTCVSQDGYYNGKVFNTTVRAHRVAYAIFYGEWPANHIDHVDGDRLNNRIANLRDVTNAENCLNKAVRASSKTGINGVTWAKRERKWRVKIGVGGKKKEVGLFDDLSSAVIARKSAEKGIGYHPNHSRARAVLAALDGETK